MALQKSFESKYGMTHTEAYHRVTSQRYEVEQRMTFVVSVYNNAQARTDGKQPVDQIYYDIPVKVQELNEQSLPTGNYVDNPDFMDYFSFAVLSQESTNVLAQFYKYMKEKVAAYSTDVIDV